MLLHSPASRRLTDWSEEGNFNCCCRHTNRQVNQHEPHTSLKTHNHLQDKPNFKFSLKSLDFLGDLHHPLHYSGLKPLENVYTEFKQA